MTDHDIEEVLYEMREARPSVGKPIGSPNPFRPIRSATNWPRWATTAPSSTTRTAMTERARWFTLSRTETVQPYAMLTRDGLVDLLARFGPAGAAEMAGLDGGFR